MPLISFYSKQQSFSRNLQLKLPLPSTTKLKYVILGPGAVDYGDMLIWTATLRECVKQGFVTAKQVGLTKKIMKMACNATLGTTANINCII